MVDTRERNPSVGGGEMSKIIIIDLCSDCPHYFHDLIRWEHKCDHDSMENRKIIKMFPKIPNWCPLPENPNKDGK